MRAVLRVPAGLQAVAPHLDLVLAGQHLAAERRGRLLAAALQKHTRSVVRVSKPHTHAHAHVRTRRLRLLRQRSRACVPSRCRRVRRCCGSERCASPCQSRCRSASPAPRTPASPGRTRLAAAVGTKQRDGHFRNRSSGEARCEGICVCVCERDSAPPRATRRTPSGLRTGPSSSARAPGRCRRWRRRKSCAERRSPL
jgi:hypothetical protein